MDGWCDPFFAKEALAERMGTLNDPVKDLEVVRLLQRSGFLIDHVKHTRGNASSYQLWSPRFGFFVASLVEGRKEILKLLQARKHKELSESQLLRAKLKKTKLGINYHLRDLIGIGLVKVLQTPAGRFYKLVPNT